MIAGTLEVQLLANIARLQQDMDQAKSVVGNAMSSINSAVSMASKALALLGVAASVDAFRGMVMGAISAQAELKKLSERTGTSVEDLSALKGAAKTSGTDMDSVAGGLQKMAKAMVESKDGTGKASDAFRTLGISSKDIAKNMNEPGQMMLLISQRLAGMQNSTEGVAAAQALLGKSGANLLPMLIALAEKGELNARLTTQQAEEAKKFEQIMIQWDGRWKALYGTIATEILPVLNEFMGALVASGGAAKLFTDQVKEWAKDGKIREWAKTAADGITALMSAIIPAAKVAAAYFAIFVAAPAIWAAVASAAWTVTSAVAVYTMNVMIGQAETIKWNAALFGTSVSADLASGSLSKMKLAGSVLFAAFAGWEIGSWLSKNFVEARIAGLTFVGLMLTGWENIKYGATMAWEAIKFAWDSTVNGMKAGFAEYISVVAKGLSFVGASDTAKQIETYADSMRKAATSQKSFAEQTAGITAEHKKELAAIDDNIVDMVKWELANDGASKATTKLAEAKAKTGAVSPIGKAEASDYEKLNKALQERISLSELEIEKGRALTEAEKEFAKIVLGRAAGTVKMSDAELALLKARIKVLETDDAIIKRRREMEELDKALLDAESKKIQAAYESLAQAEKEIENYGKLPSQITDATIAKLALRTATLEANQGTAEEIKTNEGLIAIYKRLRDTQAKKEGMDVAAKDSADAEAAWKKAADHIEGSLTDSVMNGFGHAKDFVSGFIDTAKSMFKNLILRPVVQMIMQPIAGGIASMLVPSAASAAGSSLAGSAGGSMLGGLFGATGSEFMTGLSAAWTQPVTGFLGGVEAFSTGVGTFATNIGMMIPAIGLFVAGVSVIAGLLEDGPEQNTSLQFGNNNTHGVNINQGGADTSKNYDGPNSQSPFGTFGVTGTFWMDVMQGPNAAKYQAFLDSVEKSDKRINSLLTASEQAGVKTSLSSATYSAQTGPEGSDPSAAFTQVFYERMKSIMAGIEPGLEALIDGFKGSGDQLQAEVELLLSIRKNIDAAAKTFGEPVTLQGLADAFESFKQDGETTGQVIVRMGKEFDSTNAIATMLGKDTATAFGKAGLASAQARDDLVNLAGGIDALNAQTASFYANFYTDAERSQMGVTQANQQLGETFGKLGIAIPDSTDAFRDLVASQDLSTESGRQTYEMLMGVSGAFVTVHGTAQQAAEAAAKTAGLQISLLEAQGYASEALAQKREQELAGMSETDAAIQRQINAAQDAAKTRDLEIQIMELSGNHTGAVAAQREMELRGLSDTDKALKQRIYNLQDEAQLTQQLSSFRSNMATAHGGTESQVTQGAFDNSMAALTKLIPSIQSYNQVLNLSEEDYAALTPEARDAANAALEAGNALAQLNKSLDDTYQSLIDAANGGKSLQQLSVEYNAATLSALASGISADVLSEALSGNKSAYDSLTPSQKESVNQILQNKSALAAYNAALKQSLFTYQEAVAKLNGASDLQLAQMREDNIWANLQDSLKGTALEGIGLDHALHLTSEEFNSMSPAARQLATDLVNAEINVRSLSAAVVGMVNTGSVIDAATSQIQAKLKEIDDQAKTLGNGNFRAEMEAKVRLEQEYKAQLEAQLAEEIRLSHLWEGHGANIAALQTQLAALSASYVQTAADLAEYNRLETQYSGHGQALLELEKWYDAQKAIFAGSQTNLDILAQIFQTKWDEIIAGTSTAAASSDIYAKKLDLMSQILAAGGTVWGQTAERILQQQRAMQLADLDLQDPTHALSALQQALWGLQDAAAAAAAALQHSNDVLALQAQIVALSGGTVNGMSAADILQRQRDAQLAELHTKDPTGELERLTRVLWQLQDAAAAAATAATQQSEAAKRLTDSMTETVNLMKSVESLASAIGDSIHTVRSQMPGYDNAAYTAGQLQAAQAKLSAMSTGSIKDQVAQAGVVKDAIMANYQAQMEALKARQAAEDADGQAAVAAANAAGRAATDAFNKIQDGLRSIGEFAKSLLTDTLTGLTGAQLSAQIASNYRKTLAGVNAGDIDSFGKVQGDTSAYLKDIQAHSKTQADYAFEFGKIQNDLQSVANKAQANQVWTDAQYQANTAKYEADALALQNSTIGQLDDLKALTDAWQHDLESQLSDEAIAFAQLNLTAAQILEATQNLAPEIIAAINGSVLTQYVIADASNPRANTDPNPIIVDANNPRANTVQVDTRALEAKIEALTKKMDAIEINTKSTAQNSKRSTDILRRVTLDGNSLQTTAAAS